MIMSQPLGPDLIHAGLHALKCKVKMFFVPAHFDSGLDLSDIPCYREQKSGLTLFPSGVIKFAVNGDFFVGAQRFYMIAPISKSLFFPEIFGRSLFQRAEKLFADEFHSFKILPFDLFLSLIKERIELFQFGGRVDLFPDLMNSGR